MTSNLSFKVKKLLIFIKSTPRYRQCVLFASACVCVGGHVCVHVCLCVHVCVCLHVHRTVKFQCMAAQLHELAEERWWMMKVLYAV